MLLFTTLGRYLTLRFARAIISVFGTFFFLIGTLDFVELMRRAGDSPIATTPRIITLALYRVPSVAEQIFPFAALQHETAQPRSSRGIAILSASPMVAAP